MEMLTTFLENEGVQTLINDNEKAILESAVLFHSYPQVVKDYIQENLDQFIVPGNLEATYNNMVAFTESTVMSLLEELSSTCIK